MNIEINKEVERVNARLEKALEPLIRSVKELEKQIEKLSLEMIKKANLGKTTVKEERQIKDLQKQIEHLKHNRLFRIYLEGDYHQKKTEAEKLELSEKVYPYHQEMEQIKRRVDTIMADFIKGFDYDPILKKINSAIKELQKEYRKYEKIYKEPEYQEAHRRLREDYHYTILRPKLPDLDTYTLLRICLNTMFKELSKKTIKTILKV